MFSAHTDYFERDSASGQLVEGDPSSGQRVYTGFAYLNDAFDGGHTEFPLLNISVKPTTGALLLWKNVQSAPWGAEFPPRTESVGQLLVGDPRTIHTGAMVRLGEKLGCNIWVTERPHDLYRAAHER